MIRHETLMAVAEGKATPEHLAEIRSAIDWQALLQLLITYGPQLAALILSIIGMLHPTPTPSPTPTPAAKK